MAVTVSFHSFMLKNIGGLRWALRAGIVLIAFLVLKELSSTRPDIDRALGYLVLGGGGLYALWRGIRALEGAVPRRRRATAKRVFSLDRDLSRPHSRRDLIPFLLGTDLERVVLFAWVKRLQRLLALILKAIFSGSDPKSACQNAMQRCLILLDIGRSRWGRGRIQAFGKHPKELLYQELQDEEVLQYLLFVVVFVSALFRLHYLRWSMLTWPFGREALGRLRRDWIPFCLLQPTPNLFPPPLPHEMEKALDMGCNVEKEMKVYKALAKWIFLKDKEALVSVVDAFLEKVGR